MDAPESITQLLVEWGNGDEAALNRLMPVVQDELRRLARMYLRRERINHTLQPTALINEAYLKLVDQHGMHWQNRAQFFGISAQLMRRILVDYARQARADKRGGGAIAVSLTQANSFTKQPEVDLLEIHEALERLAAFDPQQSRVVELRFFAGLTNEESAEVIGISRATVAREWTMAKAWLHRELSLSGLED
ncbi:MAG: sigma-70 family RNA polymerase sigma factor [Pyrinomonadaceae bacterium MAG19_C2-C3]|nr:sigma-70 family RNA polymerase sigma factor [Pyrinomonadaceae bacterium MAG19_C2-C3]